MAAGAQPQRPYRPAAAVASASPGKAQTILRHHKQIVDAIAAGQPDAAQAHLREHLTGTLSDLATIRGRWPDYLSG